MTARPILGTHVSLKWHRISWRLRFLPRHFSTQPLGNRQDHDEPPKDIWLEEEGDRRTDTGAPARPPLRSTLSAHSGGQSMIGRVSERPLARITARPLGRIYGYRGHELKEDRQKLNLPSLGAPAEVIVLRDAGIFFNSRDPAEEELEPPEHVDIMARLDSERGLIGQAEVDKNIEELRPEESSRVLNWEQFQSIEEQLTNGFTQPQLLRYITSFKTGPDIKLRSRGKHFGNENSDGALRRSVWMPGVSESGNDFDESYGRGYISDAFTAKQCLVIRLLRQCWQLEVQEWANAVGEIEIQVDSEDLELLIKGRYPPLRAISDNFIISQDEKIEAFRSRQVVRITAKREKAEAITEEIGDILKNISRLHVSYEPLMLLLGKKSTDEFRDSVIDEVSRLTETKITRLPKKESGWIVPPAGCSCFTPAVCVVDRWILERREREANGFAKSNSPPIKIFRGVENPPPSLSRKKCPHGPNPWRRETELLLDSNPDIPEKCACSTHGDSYTILHRIVTVQSVLRIVVTVYACTGLSH